MVVVMGVVFRRRVAWDDPELAPLLETAEDCFTLQPNPGSTLVYVFPVLRILAALCKWWRLQGDKIYHNTIG